jgi:CheY-like chemotaxis protein
LETHEQAAATARVIVAVDDDPKILELIVAGLSSYTVEVFTDPREALHRLVARPFEAMVSDYLMPEMNGIQLFEALLPYRPGLGRQFVLMTGSGTDTERERFLARHHVALLQKPFRIQQLEDILAALVPPARAGLDRATEA